MVATITRSSLVTMPRISHTNNLREYADWQRQARDAKGISQEELATDAAVDQTSISKYETGRVVPSKREVIRKIAKSLFIGNPDMDADRFGKFCDDALYAAGFRKEYEAQDLARKKDILWDAYNKTTGARRIAADAILFTNEETGEQFTLDDIAQITRPRAN